MSCYGCECIDEGSTCGKTVINGDNISLVECDSSCAECEKCDDKPFSYSNQNKNRKELNANSFLRFLKRQQEMNKENEVVSINKNKKKIFDLVNAPKNNKIENTSIKKDCSGNLEKDCLNENNCYWDNKSIQCNQLEVTFYTVEGINNVSFKLPVGNYNNQVINNFEFIPKYILVPFGLRVKIWKKEGFAGEVKGFAGNITPGTQNTELINKLMYKINIPVGSIQICNMKDCVKPSPYQNIKLINIIDGNNIDSMDRLSVTGVEDYKNRLVQNIKNRLEFVVIQYADCLDKVKEYLKINNVDININLNNIDDIHTLQRIKYTLNNLPNCKDLNLVSTGNDNLENNNLENNDLENNNTENNNLENNNLENNTNVKNNSTIKNKLNNNLNLNTTIIIVSVIIILLLLVALLYYKKML